MMVTIEDSAVEGHDEALHVRVTSEDPAVEECVCGTVRFPPYFKCNFYYQRRPRKSSYK